jgi:hypothetical protein
MVVTGKGLLHRSKMLVVLSDPLLACRRYAT